MPLFHLLRVEGRAVGIPHVLPRAEEVLIEWFAVLKHETKPVELIVNRDQLLLLLLCALLDPGQRVALVYHSLRLGIKA
jgi:hypothetical protein